ncbi:hypothetical protein BTO18_13130 [Polaribacter porphyrae]|uniref:DUF4293 domain-containing protein n=2 Tax=Polaribacter porphyrae TaxID=1137780 RepID=A0A2S7WR17_9FLAO|nr:hypothetical protein [Polaribacter porphyrae]PQJ80057.1 hypothetical protein BTO18_13130 [Polaribacter porphyrae]
MRKIARIIAIVISILLFISATFSVSSLYDLYSRNVINQLNIESSILFGFLVLCSLLFNLSKVISTKYYNKFMHNFLRYTDLAFVLLSIIFILYGISKFIKRVIENTAKSKDYLIFLVVLVIIAFCVYMLLDNFKYQKEVTKRKFIKRQSAINEIGKN